jgi:hypothetical protein
VEVERLHREALKQVGLVAKVPQVLQLQATAQVPQLQPTAPGKEAAALAQAVIISSLTIRPLTRKQAMAVAVRPTAADGKHLALKERE